MPVLHSVSNQTPVHFSSNNNTASTSKMETTMYGDSIQSQSSVRQMKRSMTLDFNVASSIKAKKAKLNTPGLLGSPDLNMLKLASPELERMIIQQNGMITTTPTPTQFLCPKFVTEEQEAYARGFVDALEELHKCHDSNDIPVVVESIANSLPLTSFSGIDVSGSFVTAAPQTTYTTLNTVSTLPSMQHSFVDTMPVVTATTMSNTMPSQSLLVHRIKEEPQIVPSISSSPPLSPVDMENQEVLKVERKRARNRIAARKCRHRKLERISRLEDKVTILKNDNETLSDTASTLRDQVCRLKQQILEHVKNGCQVMMSQNLTF